MQWPARTAAPGRRRSTCLAAGRPEHEGIPLWLGQAVAVLPAPRLTAFRERPATGGVRQVKGARGGRARTCALLIDRNLLRQSFIPSMPPQVESPMYLNFD